MSIFKEVLINRINPDDFLDVTELTTEDLIEGMWDYLTDDTKEKLFDLAREEMESYSDD